MRSPAGGPIRSSISEWCRTPVEDRTRVDHPTWGTVVAIAEALGVSILDVAKLSMKVKT